LDEFDDDDDGLATIRLKGDEGEDLDFLIIDSRVYKNNTYLLVIDAVCADDEESEAYILKELKEVDGDSIYTVLEDGQEFSEVSILFDDEDYEIEI
jgi:hypothetical protein